MPAWPEHIQPASCTWGRSRNDRILESPVSRKRQIVRRGRPLWTASVEWRVPARHVSEVRYQLEALGGTSGAVYLRDYAAKAVEPPGTITVRVAATANATAVDTEGWPPSTSNLIAAGDYVQIGSGLYVVSAASGSDALGRISVPLRTPLLAAASVGTQVIVDTPSARMRATSPKWSGSRSTRDGLWSVRMDFIERADPEELVLPTLETAVWSDNSAVTWADDEFVTWGSA